MAHLLTHFALVLEMENDMQVRGRIRGFIQVGKGQTLSRDELPV